MVFTTLSDAQKQQLGQQTAQNTHQLVNLLKQGNVVNSQQPQQIRLLTSPMAPNVTGATTFQLGNQLITITPQQGKPGPVTSVQETQPTQTLQLKVCL